mgnify:CR=1 FL=1
MSLNGREIGILWKEPFQADVTGALRPGRNVLEVKVTNLWNNRLVGDLLDPGQKPYARTNMVLKPGELIPSGLFGPVRMLSPDWEAGGVVSTAGDVRVRVRQGTAAGFKPAIVHVDKNNKPTKN